MNCKYATPSRVSDITIGDFWGIQDSKNINKVEKEKGISLVLINTKRKRIFLINVLQKYFVKKEKQKKLLMEMHI